MAAFDENTAKEIIKKYELSPTTLKVWKTRNSIPNRYFKEGFQTVKKIKESSEIQRIRTILKRREIAHTHFRTGSLHPNYSGAQQRMQDIKRGMPLVEGEILGFKDEISEIRNLCRLVMDTRQPKNMKELIEDKRIKPTNLITHKYYNRIRRDAFLDKDDTDEIVLLVTAFYNLIRI